MYVAMHTYIHIYLYITILIKEEKDHECGNVVGEHVMSLRESSQFFS